MLYSIVRWFPHAIIGSDGDDRIDVNFDDNEIFNCSDICDFGIVVWDVEPKVNGLESLDDLIFYVGFGVDDDLNDVIEMGWLIPAAWTP